MAEDIDILIADSGSVRVEITDTDIIVISVSEPLSGEVVLGESTQFDVVVSESEVGPTGPQGSAGRDGADGEAGPQNLFVQPLDPAMTGPGLWIHTGLGLGGDDVTFWVEDGL